MTFLWIQLQLTILLLIRLNHKNTTVPIQHAGRWLKNKLLTHMCLTPGKDTYQMFSVQTANCTNQPHMIKDRHLTHRCLYWPGKDTYQMFSMQITLRTSSLTWPTRTTAHLLFGISKQIISQLKNIDRNVGCEVIWQHITVQIKHMPHKRNRAEVNM